MKKFLLLLSFFTLSNAYSSSFNKCSQVFYNKTPPIVFNKKLAKDNFNLCYTGFAVNYSGVAKTGLWAAELLTYDSLLNAKGIKREDIFYEEEMIPLKYRSGLGDYRGSGYDRGHLAAAGNRFNTRDKAQSFSLANMIPQNPYNNQEVWRNVEEALRSYVLKSKQPVYVITGGLYIGKKLKTIGNFVLVPTHVYKVVLFPKLGVVGAWVAVNDASGRVDVTSVAELQRYSGVQFFPTIKDTSILNYRYLLPLSSSSSYKLGSITIATDSQNSYIFNEMPNQAYKASRKQYSETYKNNWKEMVDITQNSRNDVLDTSITIIKKVLQ